MHLQLRWFEHNFGFQVLFYFQLNINILIIFAYAILMVIPAIIGWPEYIRSNNFFFRNYCSLPHHYGIN